MTESAKQDGTEDPAGTAETASAATTEETAKDAAAVFEAAGVGADGATEDADKPEIDDVKAKFREALDRKRQVHAEGQGKGAHEAGKVSGAHGPAASRRSFRRKSG